MMTAFSRVTFLILTLVLPLATPFWASAQETITITEGSVEPTPIAIANFTGLDGLPSDVGRTIAEVISNDLEDSGMFRPEETAALIPPPADLSIKPDFSEWEPLGVKALLVGSASIDERGVVQVQFILWDIAAQNDIVGGQGEVMSAGVRRMSHKIADYVFKAWTGDDGYFDTRVVYVEESGPASNRIKRLAIMDQDGYNHTYLTDGTSLVLTPRFSPQAQEIAYLDYFNDDPRVYLLNVTTGNPS